MLQPVKLGHEGLCGYEGRILCRYCIRSKQAARKLERGECVNDSSRNKLRLLSTLSGELSWGRMQYNFEWDPAKAKANMRKHGVSLEQAAEIFTDPLQLALLNSEQVLLKNDGSHLARRKMETYWL